MIPSNRNVAALDRTGAMVKNRVLSGTRDARKEIMFGRADSCRFSETRLDAPARLWSDAANEKN
jgi:hypothetical protein